MSEFPITERTRVRRVPKRAQYDKDTIYRVLDEGLVCHVGLVEDHQPVVIPMNYGRREDALILHGASASGLLKYVQAGHPVCGDRHALGWAGPGQVGVSPFHELSFGSGVREGAAD